MAKAMPVLHGSKQTKNGYTHTNIKTPQQRMTCHWLNGAEETPQPCEQQDYRHNVNQMLQHPAMNNLQAVLRPEGVTAALQFKRQGPRRTMLKADPQTRDQLSQGSKPCKEFQRDRGGCNAQNIWQHQLQHWNYVQAGCTCRTQRRILLMVFTVLIGVILRIV